MTFSSDPPGGTISITYRMGDRESTANLGTLDKNAFDPSFTV